MAKSTALQKTITVKQLSEMWGLSYVYCYQVVHRPDFYPAFKVGKRILINIDMLNQWMKEQGEKPIG